MVAKHRPSAMRFSKAVVRRASIIQIDRGASRQPVRAERGGRCGPTEEEEIDFDRDRKEEVGPTSNIGPLSMMRFSKVVVRRASIDLSRERRQPVSRFARSEGGADGGGQEIDFDRDLKGSARHHRIVGRWRTIEEWQRSKLTLLVPLTNTSINTSTSFSSGIKRTQNHNIQNLRVM